MEKITYQKVYDSKGDFTGIQLHQRGQYITISLGSTQLDVQKDAPKWGNIKPIIDKFQDQVGAEATQVTGDDKVFQEHIIEQAKEANNATI